MAKTKPELPTGPLPDLLAWWKKTRVKGLIIGGLAVALRGRPRTTQDVDAIVFVKEDRWSKFLEAGERLAFQSRVPDRLRFARENRVFLVQHDTTGIDIDLAIGAVPFERQALKRATMVKIGQVSAPVATAEDLIVLKTIAFRPKDQVDISGLLEVCPKLDLAYVRENVAHFASMLEMPEILENLEQMLSSPAKRKRRSAQ